MMDQNTKPKLFSEFPPVQTASWEERIVADLKGGDYAKKLIWKTDEGFDIRPYYRAEDLDQITLPDSLPGMRPCLQGGQASGNPWIIRQDIGTTGIRECNRLALEMVSRGVDAIGVKANGVTTHKELSDLLEGIDFGQTAVNFISAQSYPLALEFLIYEMKHRGFDGKQMRGSVNFDALSYLLLHGEFYISWENNLEEAEYLLKIVRENMPSFRVLTVNGHYYQDGGSTLVQELAFSLASASEYLAGLTARGLTADEIAPYMQFSLAIGPGYFLELAKIRAARLLWSKMVEQYGATRDESYRLFIHASTALWNKSIYDPYVNMLRTTTEGMSAILGNADSVTILPFDASLREPDDFSRRIARNQQLVLKEEAYLDKIADPGAGSYYIESLTASVAAGAWTMFTDIEHRGGMLACIKSGYIQEEIEKSRNRKSMDIAQRKLILLGTNQYPNLAESISEPVRPLQSGETQSTTYKKLTPFRVAEQFETLRLATDKAVNSGRKRPAVFLLTMGNLAMLRARAGFATNFFGCAGYDIMDNPGFPTVSEGVASAVDSGAEVIVICSSDEEYVTLVPGIATELKAAGCKARVVVAGYPKEQIETYKAAGIDDFIHVRSNLLESLRGYHAWLGIL